MKGIGAPSLLLKLSLFWLLRTTTTGVFSAPNVADHHLETHLMEWKTLPTGERVSSAEKMHRQYMQTWKRKTAEASAQQWRAKRAAIASDSHGRKLSDSRSLMVANAANEVNALLAFRSAIPMDPTGALTNWTLEKGATHCSTWKGVTCDELGKVTEIDLRDLGLDGTISPSIGDLAHLSSLNLSRSSLWGAIPSSLGRCQNLSVLDLSHNSLSGQVPMELFALPRLEILWLSNNAISGRLPEVVEAKGCQSMTNLWIDNSEISGTLPSSLSKCQNLEVVSFSNNQLNGSIPAALGGLHQLQQLWLDSNVFSGPIPSELGSLTKLQWLILEANELTGELPLEVGNCTSLNWLDLGWNQLLNGSIPPTLGLLTNLSTLSLMVNSFTGGIPPELGKLKQLETLWLGRNNDLGGSIPREVSSLTTLVDIDLGSCNFSGAIPEDLFTNNLNIKRLLLNENQFSGTVPASIGKLSDLEANLDLSENHLSGNLPLGLGNLTKLRTLILATNQLNGTIPEDLGGCVSLNQLDLSSNQFTGGIPKFLGNFSSLVILDLSNNALNDNAVALSSLNQCPKLETLLVGHNNIYGSFPEDFTRWPSLKYFSVTGNKLTGGIPLSFGSINSSLVLADFSRNKFTGAFPAEVDGSHLSELRVLLFSHNEIGGSIPSWFGNLKSLQVLDLSFNQLTGSIPPNFGNLDGYKVQIDDASSSPYAMGFSIQRLNWIFGVYSVSFLLLPQTSTFMELSSNALQGEIPIELAELVGMKYLNLSNNRFDGNLWAAVQNLTALESFDVSRNNLSGPLPPALPPSLRTFKVFLNNFSGAIPFSGGQYDTFSSSDYLPGNPGLCGRVIQRFVCATENVDSLNSLHNGFRVSDSMSLPAFVIGAAGGFCIVAMTALLWAPARAFVLGAAKKRRATAKVQPAYGLFRPRN